MTEGHPIGPHRQPLENIEKLDNVTWFGHCVIHIAVAVRDLPTPEAKLQLIQTLRSYLERQKCEIGRSKSDRSANCASRRPYSLKIRRRTADQDHLLSAAE